MKKIITFSAAAVILATSLAACGSNDVENMSIKHDLADASETTENAASETADEMTLVPETYEDYIKLDNTYLQTDNVLQALAILDEGIEKLGAGEQSAETQVVDLISQRK